MAADPIVGIDLGGTNVQIGVTDSDGNVLSRSKRKTPVADGPEGIVDCIAGGVEEACEAASVKLADVACVGIGAPGPIEQPGGIVIEAPNLRWKGVPLKDLLSTKLGKPVTVENDVNVAIWGEVTAGAAKGATDVMGVWVGTGVGGGLVLDGKLRSGRTGSAGEIGHTPALPRNPPGLRSVEQLYSRTALCNRARAMIRADAESVITELTGGDLEKIKSKVLGKAYAAKDALVMNLIHDAAEGLGCAIAAHATVMGLDLIVMGGGLTEAIGEPFVSRVKETVRREVFPSSMKGIEVVASKLEDDAGVVGAAMLAKAANAES